MKAPGVPAPVFQDSSSGFDKRVKRSIRRKIFRGARHAIGTPRESLSPTAKDFDAIGADK